MLDNVRNQKLKSRYKQQVDNKGLNLKINEGEVHAIMGQTDLEKALTANILSGKPGYNISGELKYEGEDLTQISIEERAQKGVFLHFSI